MKRITGIFLITLCTTIGCIVGIGAYHWGISEFLSSKGAQSTFEEKQQVHFTGLSDRRVDVVDAYLDFTKASSLTTPGVVHIKSVSEEVAQTRQFDPFRDFFGFRFDSPYSNQQPRKRMGSGSGVIISEDGYIVTNNHVIQDADEINIVLNDKRSFVATVIGTDITTDLALLKIEESGLPFLRFGNSDEVQVGQWVLAVGNPFNLTSTVTAGIVSAKARSINILDDKYRIESYIQTDAVVNRGNSGGALVNTVGELVGINSAIQSQTGAYIGYSFAIPVNLVKKVMDDLLRYGTVQRGFIGVSIRDVDSKLANELQLDAVSGVYIAALTPNGSAAEAGIKSGDVIHSINGIDVNSASELQEQVGRYRPGDEISISVNRNGEVYEKQVVLKNKQGTTAIVKKELKQFVTALGAEFEDISAEDRSRFRLRNGVKIRSLKKGKLQNTGIREGFIITHINKRPVNTPEDIASVLEKNRGEIIGIEGIYPQDGTRYYYGFSM
ncbi:Do family serine endopeptidase [bacterium AH-315-C07]|nr:Do family serine endopeptidase [bacterium AH-315-C07]